MNIERKIEKKIYTIIEITKEYPKQIEITKEEWEQLGKLDKFLDKKRINIVSYLLMIFVVYDIAISCIAVNRQCERKKGIPARNNYEAYLDRTYPDERLDKIFNNKREVE